MPDKPLTVFTYAASASLAAVALVYFFHPSYLFDSDPAASSANSRKRAIVGLHNPANDCFINCVLQSLAGLGDLRVFLIREIHRRELASPEIYESLPLPAAGRKAPNPQKLRSLQKGEVIQGLKDMIDRLNEKPLYRKTITAGPFIRVLEHAFGSTISKAQQDAQEFLQLVAERLCEEYHAGAKARRRFALPEDDHAVDSAKEEVTSSDLAEEGFPLEGKTETIVECEHCHFRPKANETKFVMLNLMVPQSSSATLNDCYDAHFKREYIDDYKCDKCRLQHALGVYDSKIQAAGSESEIYTLRTYVEMTKDAIANDPEKLPEALVLPDISLAPKRKISRHVEITSFPKILVIHLSRSIFDRNSYSMKNIARVQFPERFAVGGLIHRREYRLSGVIAHSGTHNSGHYETFRKQNAYLPFFNPLVDSQLGPFSKGPSPSPSTTTSPNIQPRSSTGDESSMKVNSEHSTDSVSARTSGVHSSPSTEPSTAPDEIQSQTPPEDVKSSPTATSHTPANPQFLRPPSSAQSNIRASSLKSGSRRIKRTKKAVERWWRISDDKIKECKTSEVLGMTREVYMLFYEL